MSAQRLVQMLTEFAKLCDEEYTDERMDPDGALHEADAEVLVIMLAALRDCRADLQVLFKRVESDLVATSGNRRFVVPGVGEVEIKRGNNRSAWDHEDLAKHVIARALDERVIDEDGVVQEPSHETVARVLLECAHVDYWRKTVLATHGIDADEFCKVTPGTYAVKLPPRST